VNTARAAVIDEDALIEALSDKRIAGAGLDVFTGEPLPSGSPFFKLDNCVLLPHIGGASHDVTRHHSIIISEAISDYLSGKGARCVANPQVILRLRGCAPIMAGEYLIIFDGRHRRRTMQYF